MSSRHEQMSTDQRRDPDRRARRDELVVQNLPLVGYLVSDLCARATHLSRDDLAAVGALALVTAADAFDPALGVPFGAYARQRITGALADDLRSGDWASRGTRRRIKQVLAVQETLTTQLGRMPGPDEIAAALGVSRAEATEALADASRTVGTIDDVVESTLAATVDGPEETAARRERDRHLRRVVAALPEKMRYIVEALYFGDRTVKDLAAELGVTHSAVSQQRTAALKLIREAAAELFVEDAAESRAKEPASAAARARLAAYRAQLADLAMSEKGAGVRDAVRSSALAS